MFSFVGRGILRGYFSGEGFFEVINLPFTTEDLNKLFAGLWQSRQARRRSQSAGKGLCGDAP